MWCAPTPSPLSVHWHVHQWCYHPCEKTPPRRRCHYCRSSVPWWPLRSLASLLHSQGTAWKTSTNCGRHARDALALRRRTHRPMLTTGVGVIPWRDQGRWLRLFREKHADNLSSVCNTEASLLIYIVNRSIHDEPSFIANSFKTPFCVKFRSNSDENSSLLEQSFSVVTLRESYAPCWLPTNQTITSRYLLFLPFW